MNVPDQLARYGLTLDQHVEVILTTGGRTNGVVAGITDRVLILERPETEHVVRVSLDVLAMILNTTATHPAL